MIYYGIAALWPLVMWFFNYYVTKVRQLNDKQKRQLQYFLTVIAILPMFLLFVLRYKYIGADTIGYVRFFENEVRKYTFAELLNSELIRTEVGYRVYVKLISLFTNNYTVFFLVNGLVIFGGLLHFSRKYTENPFVFFFLFMALGTYNFMETGLRQAIAMVICVWSIDFLNDKKIIRFILLVVLASLFHQSAIIFLILLPLSIVKRMDWIIVTHTLVAIVFFIGFSSFHDLFNQWLGYEYNIEETGNGEIFFMLVLVLFAFSLFMSYGTYQREKEKTIILHLSLLTVILWLLRLISRTAERVSYYYIMGLYAYFAGAVECRKDKLSNLLKGLLIVACFILFVHRSFDSSYLFFWQTV